MGGTKPRKRLTTLGRQLVDSEEGLVGHGFLGELSVCSEGVLDEGARLIPPGRMKFLVWEQPEAKNTSRDRDQHTGVWWVFLTKGKEKTTGVDQQTGRGGGRGGSCVRKYKPHQGRSACMNPSISLL